MEQTACATTVAEIAAQVERAREAQRVFDRLEQELADTAALAAGWALLEPDRNRRLAELAVTATGMGRITDKIAKNRRKTLGLLHDLEGVKSIGVLTEDHGRGLLEIGRPLGIVAALTPSTHPVASPANKIINALKCGNAIVLAPSPRAHAPAQLLVEYVRAQLTRVGLPADLVQILPAPVSRAATETLMRLCDRVMVTGSQKNVRAAQVSGTPALGVGQGNAPVIVDETADLERAAAHIAASKSFDHGTSCSSESVLVVVADVWRPLIAALARQGGVLLAAEDKARLARVLWPEGKGTPDRAAVGRSAQELAQLAGLVHPASASARFLMVEETGIGPHHPYSGEKLSPVLALYRVPDFPAAQDLARRLLAYQGKGHSVGIHTRQHGRALALAKELPTSRVIVNQPHCFGAGGSFENGLPFTLSLGCGSWGGNLTSDNIDYRAYRNISRVAFPIGCRKVTEETLFGAFWERFGR